MVLASNRSLAEFNLTRQRELTEGKCRLQQLSEEGQKLLENIEAVASQLSKLLHFFDIIMCFAISFHLIFNIFSEEKSGTTNAETILALLQTAAAEIEEESEVCLLLYVELYGFKALCLLHCFVFHTENGRTLS